MKAKHYEVLLPLLIYMSVYGVSTFYHGYKWFVSTREIELRVDVNGGLDRKAKYKKGNPMRRQWQ
ncbi:MAG: hypothetical protein CME61_00455 [Halobacteriovoraceae bacterium]|nr:hypothetical protein [Halobacteriovoraceae bacterium]|tara:strand:+ start:1757 stop:1951 length:195 start_codon:yes stop_codon:yes gene_type:complete